MTIIALFLETFEKIETNLVVSDCFLVNARKDTISDSFFKVWNSRSGFLKNFYKSTHLGCCMAFNRKVLEASLPFPKGVFSHDTWIGLIGEMIGKTYFVNEQLIYFRRHGENFYTHSLGNVFLNNKSPNSFSKIISLRLILSLILIMRFIKLQIKSR